MALPNNPQTRKEMYLSNMAGQGTALPSEPHTREEEYLDYIAKNGGGGGTGEGDMTKAVYDDDLAVASAGGIADYVAGAITGKVDKVQGKGLSTNDYDDSAKAIVDGVTTALEGKVSKSNTAGLVKNDGTIDTTITGAVAANTSAISTIKDGANIDSFGDVETALAGKMPNYGIGTGLYVDSDTNQLRADAVTLAIKDSPKLITSGAVFSGLSPKYGTADQDETDVDGQDKFPFYDNSASAKRHTTFGNIKAKLKEYFDSLYVAAVAGKGLSTNDYDDTEKAKVAAAFPRSEQAVLGAKNRWKDELYNRITDNAGLATHTVADGVVTIEASATNNAGVFISQNNLRNAFANINTPHILSVEIKGDSAFALTVAVESSGILTQAITNDWVRYTVTITDPSQFKIFYFYNKSGAAHTFYIRNFMLYDANNPDPSYAPYAMTNKELTDAVSVKNGLSSVTVIEGATLSANDSFLRKQNNVISAQLRVNGVTANSGANIATIPSGYIPSLTGGTVVFMSNASTGEMIPAYITINGYVRARTNLSSVDVNINFTYIAP